MPEHDYYNRGILVADGGATSINWMLALRNHEGKEILISTDSAGVNAVHSDSDIISRSFSEASAGLVKTLFPDSEIDCKLKDALKDLELEIYYYGAGCKGDSITDRIKSLLEENFRKASISVESDLLGAARAGLGHNSGMIAILGTGSNSGLYDGTSLISNTPPLGFILGDEGSGAAIGKRLLGDLYKGLLPDELKEYLTLKCNLSYPEVINNVYRGEYPAKFLAHMTRPLSDILSDSNEMAASLPLSTKEYINQLLIDSFDQFFKRNFSQYRKLSDSTDIAVVGSLAKVFRKQLETAAQANGFKIVSVISSPITKLMEYHLEDFQQNHRRHI